MLVGSLDKTEIKIILTFFIIYFLFSHWTSWNEESRISLTKSISREGTFKIDTYANFTGDRAFYENHYYSEKAPGTSFLATPISLILDYLSSDVKDCSEDSKILISEQVLFSTIYFFYDISIGESLLQILTVTLLSALPGALLVLLIYKTTNLFIKNKFYSLVTSLSFGMGSLIFIYSSVLMGNLLATFLSFLAFYIFLSNIKNKIDQRIVLLSGTLIGFSCVVNYLMIFVFVAFVLFILMSKFHRKKIIYFILGSFLGVLPLLIYNFIIFSNPIRFTRSYIDPGISPCHNLQFPECEILNKLGFNDWVRETLTLPANLLRIYFYPYRGIFFYTPFLILSIIGFYYFYKKEKKITIFLLLVFILFSVFPNYYLFWHGGSSFGLRYMVPVLPFLSIPFAALLQKTWKNIYVKIFSVFLISISIFYNFLGASTGWEGYIHLFKEDELRAELEWSTKKFEIPYKKTLFLNPLYDHYLPMFIKNGPRSRILEGILSGGPSNIDIRDFKPIKVREVKLFTLLPFGIFVLKVPFLILPLLSFFVILIWREEIFDTPNKTSVISLIFIIVTFLYFLNIFLEPKNVVYNNEWYPTHVNGTNVIEDRWMSQKASIYLYSSKTKNSSLSLNIGAFYRPRRLMIEIGNQTSKHLISSFSDVVTLPEVSLKKGENKINLKALTRCDTPTKLINGSEDYRCLNFIIRDVVLVSHMPKDEIIFGNGWYYPDPYLRWSKGNSTMHIFSSEKVETKISMSLVSYYVPREIKMFVNGLPFDTIKSEPYEIDVLTKTFSLKKGLNKIRFYSDVKCRVPAIMEGSKDTRCLSFGVFDVGLVSP